MQQFFLGNPNKGVYLDSSAAIDLIASGYSEEITEAIPNHFYVADSVLHELRNGRDRGLPHADEIDTLMAKGLTTYTELDEEASPIFESLVIGSGKDTLDDCESATIALAVSTNSYAMIDERKGIRICKERFPNLELTSSTDLFRHPAVTERLKGFHQSKAVYNALRISRMRVLPQNHEWVVQLIGPELASKCPSLPRFVSEQS